MPSPVTVRNVARLQWPFEIRPTGTQIFQFQGAQSDHNLITCESKVQVIVFLGSW